MKHIQFHPTNSCNLDCVFCWRHHDKRKHEDASPGRFLELTKEACMMGPDSITISGGGEPLLRAGLVREMIAEIKGSGARGSGIGESGIRESGIRADGIGGVLITNGCLISPGFADHLIRSQWDEVQFSIFGAKPETDDLIKGRSGSFRKLVGSLHHLNKAKKNSGSHLPRLVFRYIVTRHNYLELYELAELAAKTGVSGVFVRHVNEGPRGGLSITGPEMAVFRDQVSRSQQLCLLKNISMKLEMELDGPGAGTAGASGRCPVIDSEMVVFATGMASPCCNFFEEQFSGNGLQDANILSLAAARRGFENLRSAPKCIQCTRDMKAHIDDVY
ncbi:MAG: radical SAM protein [archaeon]